MKMLLSTTALVVSLGFPAMVLAQATADASAAEQRPAEMPGFLVVRGPSDLFASELIGHDVYARRTTADTSAPDGQAGANAPAMHRMADMRRAELDEMDNIGQITEIVLSNEGQVRAIVIGIGGFLGLGERDVAVTMDQVTFAADADDHAQIYVVVNPGADMLRESPAYERSAAMEETPERTEGMPAQERTAFIAPDVDREGYTRVAMTEVSTETLMGTTVYDVNDNNVGTVEDMILDDAGTITNVIIDFGGFLGMGSNQVSVGFDELTIMTNDGNTDFRVYVDATKAQIQAQPQYQISN